jgi:hypothetical protein
MNVEIGTEAAQFLSKWDFRGFRMLAACTVFSPGFLASYWSAGFGTFLQVSALASHWLLQILRQRRRKTQYSANHSLCNASSKPIQAMNNYTPLKK